MDCPERDKLMSDASLVLSGLVIITRQQIQALFGDDEAAMILLERELMNTVREKERILAALHQHRKEHGC
jgi:hypothetical protein